MTTAFRTLAAFLLFIAALPAHAQQLSDKDRFGQVIRVALPAAAAALSIYHDDVEGVRQLVFATTLSAGSTELLKKVVGARRPDGRERDSFPSGHAAITFTAAAYVHERYSLTQALPFYGLAILTGYKRVHTRNHFTRDVIAGAAVGIVSAWALTGRYMPPRSMASVGYWDKTLTVNYASTW
jgi:membrane-associated phospholipid phosphatase